MVVLQAACGSRASDADGGSDWRASADNGRSDAGTNGGPAAVDAAPAPSVIHLEPIDVVPVTDFDADQVCVHGNPDGTCVLPTSSDQDADGVPVGEDCNDHDTYVYPGAPEAECDNVDDDCDGKDFCPVDADGDEFSPPVDCDDNDASRNPNKPEIWCNGIDEDCNGKDDCDHDGDRIPESQDCNDYDPSISPVTSEVLCDAIDQNCDGTDCCNNDEDGDGAPCSSDCNDRDPKVYPGAPVPTGCYWKDVNCDGQSDGICSTQ